MPLYNLPMRCQVLGDQSGYVLVPFPEHGGPYLLEIDGRTSTLHRATVRGGKTGCGYYTEHNWLPCDTDRERVGIAARALYRLMAGDVSIEQHLFAIAAVQAYDERRRGEISSQ